MTFRVLTRELLDLRGASLGIVQAPFALVTDCSCSCCCCCVCAYDGCA